MVCVHVCECACVCVHVCDFLFASYSWSLTTKVNTLDCFHSFCSLKMERTIADAQMLWNLLFWLPGIHGCFPKALIFPFMELILLHWLQSWWDFKPFLFCTIGAEGLFGDIIVSSNQIFSLQFSITNGWATVRLKLNQLDSSSWNFKSLQGRFKDWKDA